MSAAVARSAANAAIAASNGRRTSTKVQQRVILALQVGVEGVDHSLRWPA